MKIKFVKFLFSTILLTTAFCSLNAQTSSIVSGKVLDTKNLPIHGVKVQITYIPWNRVINALTNEKGVFSVGNLSPGGPYLVKFSLSGYKDYTREVSTLELGNSNDLSLHMQKEIQEAKTSDLVGNPLVQNEVPQMKSSTL